jgi:hypothetical protein
MAKTNHMSARATPEGRDLLLYQSLYRRARQASEALKRLYLKRDRPSIDKDALWEGHYACRLEAERFVSLALETGRILTVFYDD